MLKCEKYKAAINMSGKNVTKILTPGKRVVVIEEIVETLQFPTELSRVVVEHEKEIKRNGGVCIAFFLHEETDKDAAAVELRLDMNHDTKEPQFMILIGYNGEKCLFEYDLKSALEVFLNSIDKYADELDKKI